MNVEAFCTACGAQVPDRALSSLVNNAGIMTGKRLNERLVRGGFVDETVWTNHCGPAALASRLAATFDVGRVVMVSSRLETRGRADLVVDLDPGGPPPAAAAYATSKQCNLLFAREFARRRPDVLVTSVTPGMVNTELGRYHPLFRISAPLRHLLLPTPAQGAESLVHCATAPAETLARNGYYSRSRGRDDPAIVPIDPSPAARDDALARALWEKTDTWTGGALRAGDASTSAAADLCAKVPLAACASGHDL